VGRHYSVFYTEHYRRVGVPENALVTTTVKIYLRRHLVAEAKVEEAPKRPDASILAAGETVLFVDDDDDVREYTAAALRSLGYRVIEANDAASALHLLEERPDVALLFTDVAMPGLNGRQLVTAARERLPALKVLYTTGYARNAIVHHGLLDAGVDLLPKPFTADPRV